jgi:hypothetical protein
MPRLVTEIAQGNTFSQSSESSQMAFSASRAWKLILNDANESLDVNAATGVNIGTPYSGENPIPCVSIECRADGESRLVRIITATYRATPGADPGADPRTQEPAARPALYSMSASLQEITCWSGKPVVAGVSQAWGPAANPVGDLYDGVSRLEPVVTINIDQYSYTDQSHFLGLVGYVNSDQIYFSSLSIAPHCAMLQNVSCNPVVEQFGETIFRGFKITFAFGVRAHWTFTRNGVEAIGWDIAVPQTGYNIKNTGVGRSDVNLEALNLEHQSDTGTLVTPYRVATGSEGRKMQARVSVSSPSGGICQRIASQPVALNDDGTPRSPSATPPVLINRACLQQELAFGNNFQNFGIIFIG